MCDSKDCQIIARIACALHILHFVADAVFRRQRRITRIPTEVNEDTLQAAEKLYLNCTEQKMLLVEVMNIYHINVINENFSAMVTAFKTIIVPGTWYQ